MDLNLAIKFLVFLFCSLICLAQWTPYTPDIYPVPYKKDCVFPFNYNGKPYNDCTTDGDNGDISWCSLTKDYQGLATYCFDFRNTTLQCAPNFTMPGPGGGKTYTKCDYLTPTAKYKQCRTFNSSITFRYCTDALSSPTLPSVGFHSNCNPIYKNLATFHSMCYGPSPYGFQVPLNSSEIQDIVDMHNSYRNGTPSRYMFKLYWDLELTRLAQAHADMCFFDHDQAVNRFSPLYFWKNGQNMVMSSEIRSTPASLIDMMLSSEQPNFVYGSGCVNNSDTCLHYTQAMLSNLTRVGCGQTHCVYPDRIERYLVCNYLQSQYTNNYPTPYIPSSTPCIDCPLKANDGLCDCGNKICRYDRGEYLEPATCNCKQGPKKRSVRQINSNNVESESNEGATNIKGKDHKKKIKKIPIHKRETNDVDPIEAELQNSQGNFIGIKNGQTAGNIGKRYIKKPKPFHP